MSLLTKIQINHKKNIKEAVEKVNAGGIGFAVVVDDARHVIGVFTDGDFRRAILSGVHLNEPVTTIINRHFAWLPRNYSNTQAETIFAKGDVKHIPVLANNQLVDIVFKDAFYKKYKQSEAGAKRQLSQAIPAVIMAGGRGTRMEPFTQVLPKPLIPVGEKTMIELIMDAYCDYGVEEFFVSVNYKANLIKAYFDDPDKSYAISYIEEDTPLGTAGALKFLEGRLQQPFFVSNCDILIRDDYATIFDYHREQKNRLTIVASMQRHTVPYGVCEIENGGTLKGISEKPAYDFLVNTGMYILDSSVLEYIPENTFFNITDLIQVLLQKKIRVGVYPVSEKAYIDIGQWDVYKKNIRLLSKSFD